MTKTLTTIVFCFTLVASASAIDTIDIIMGSKASSMKEAGLGPVTYPHKLHEQWYECKECHPKIFVEKKGGNDINMNNNMTGLQCGYSGCHNSAYAFPLYLCDSCHEVLQKPKEK